MKAIECEPQELVNSLVADLAGSFEQLMQTYQHRLYSLALRLSGNAQDAEEIAQDAFVNVYRALRDYPAERIAALALRPWLYRITLNVYRNRVRGKRVGLVPLEEPGEGEGQPVGVADAASSGRGRPEEAAMQAELQGELAALLATLPGRYRIAVILRYVEGLSYAELAEALEQPVGTVKAHVHRGIRQLRERMSGLADSGGRQ